jgi:hypothetical protein
MSGKAAMGAAGLRTAIGARIFREIKIFRRSSLGGRGSARVLSRIGGAGQSGTLDSFRSRFVNVGQTFLKSRKNGKQASLVS